MRKHGRLAKVASAIDDASIDNNDNDKSSAILVFFLVNPGNHKVIGRIKCFQTSC